MELHQLRGQAALREEGRQAEGEVRKGKDTVPAGAPFVFFCLLNFDFSESSMFHSLVFIPPQEVAAYRQKTKGGAGSAGKAPAKVEKKVEDDDDDDDDDEEDEEEEDDDDDDE